MTVVDYLEADPEISDQRFALVSMVLPESIVEKREVFYVTEFLMKKLETLGVDEEKAKNLQEEFQDFKYANHKDLTEKFNVQNEYRNNLSALKIRGVYQTQNEAKSKAQRLQRTDPNFHIFVADVGKWLPLFPSIESQVENQEYAEEQLNQIIKEYVKNKEEKDVLYEKEKAEKIKAAHMDAKAQKEKKVSDEPVSTEPVSSYVKDNKYSINPSKQYKEDAKDGKLLEYP
jgi:hypothetical protein